MAHDALIQQWTTLRGWLETDRAGLRLHRRLTQAAQTWQEVGREAGALYRSTQLAQAVEWTAENGADMNPLEQEFLDASVQLQAQEEARTARRNVAVNWKPPSNWPRQPSCAPRSRPRQPNASGNSPTCWRARA